MNAANLIGYGVFAAGGLMLLLTLARLGSGGRGRALLNAFGWGWLILPIGVLGVPIAALWGWSRAVDARVPGLVGDVANQEASANLRILLPESPLDNAESFSYGVGAGSVAMLAALLWFALQRPKLTERFGPGWWIAVAWVAFGYLAFSSLGSGVARYLTPVWPGIAILGGLWFAHALSNHPAAKGIRIAGYAIVLGLAVGQTAWYGVLRDDQAGFTSPRDLIAELLAAEPPTIPPTADAAMDEGRLGTLGFNMPAIDVYFGQVVPEFGWAGDPDDLGGTVLSMRALRTRVLEQGPYLLLARDPSDLPDPDSRGWEFGEDKNPLTELAKVGLRGTVVPTSAEFRVDRFETQVAAILVEAMPAPESPEDNPFPSPPKPARHP